MKTQTIETIERNKIIVVVRGYNAETTLKIADALVEGGIKLVEVPFEQNGNDVDTALKIKALCDRFGDKLVVGAGTVLTTKQLRLAKNSGAKYVISPNTNKKVVRKTLRYGLVSVPGAMTPTEIVTAEKLGADFVKLFPAGALGAKFFSDVTTPLSRVKILAVSGITLENIESFAKVGAVGYGISGAIVDKTAVQKGDFAKITALAKQFVEKLG